MLHLPTVYYILFLAIIGYLIYWVRKPKRRPLRAFDEQWQKLLEENVDYYRRLTDIDKQRFGTRVMQFLSEVKVTGVNLELKPLDEALVAASATIPVFGFDEWEYAYLDEVLVYPSTFNKGFEYGNGAKDRNVMGMVGDGYMNGKMILSRNSLRNGFKNTTDKHNTAIHEFVHLLDKEDGSIDGLPEVLMSHQYSIPWLKMIHHKMEEINKDKSDIRNYGGTSETEFFAVASEYFFERPDQFKRNHPELYTMMVQCFKQEPKYAAKKKR
ncbi:MAG: Mlc titration factor MtfA (ptsG expression regulator) [Bacteroidia bacterium]|jgi:Mlc titration factor MtfA (ptsG expression regulator)